MTKTHTLTSPMYVIMIGNEFYAIDSSSGYPYQSPWVSTAKNFGSAASAAKAANIDSISIFKNELLTPVKVTGIVYENVDTEIETAYQKELAELNRKYGKSS